MEVHKTVEDYYDNFLQLYAIIPQQLNDVYLKKTKIGHYWNA
jgi:hypothetical protein